jgi:hypothetical protein
MPQSPVQSPDTFYNSGPISGPAGQRFRVRPRAVSRLHVRGITGRNLQVVLLAMLRNYLLPTHRVDRYQGRSPVRCLTLSAAGRTGLSGPSLPVPLGPRPAILPARPLERLGRTGHPLARGERLQAAAPWADSSEPALLRAEVPRLPPAR